MPLIGDREKCIDALRLAIPKRHNYLWLQGGLDSRPLYSLPWREVWCEIADIEIKDLLEEGQQKEGLWPIPRQVVAIMDEPEKVVTRVFPFDRLMPLYFLNGPDKSLESQKRDRRQGSSLARQLTRMKLLSQVQRISRGILVVFGGNDAGQWQDILDELFYDGILPDVLSIQVFLLGAMNKIDFDREYLDERKQDIYIWDDDVRLLVEALADAGSLSYTGHEILVGKDRVPVADILIGAISRIDEDYYIIETGDLEEVNEVDNELFNRFMAEIEPCWEGFAAGLDMDRSYRPLDYKEVKKQNNPHSLSKLGDALSYKNTSLAELLECCLEISKMETGGNWTITVPAERGSGISTLLWSSVYKLARGGYPVLILKQGLRQIDYKALTNFLTRLNREARFKSGGDSDVPVLILCDIEHQGIDDISKLASLLYNDGRLCVVLRAIDKNELGKDDKDEQTYRARGQEIKCKTFQAEVNNQEIMKLREHLLAIKEQYQLVFDVPSEEAWRRYQEKSSVLIPQEASRWDRQLNPTKGNDSLAKSDLLSLFWVGLRFFIDNNQWTPDRLETQLIQNIEELYEENAQTALLIYSIAVSTRFRLALPVTVLVHAYKIYDWIEFIDELKSIKSVIPYIVYDYLPGDTMMIRFRHTAFAEVVLKHLNQLLRNTDRIDWEHFPIPASFACPVEWLHHLLANLRAGDDMERQFGNMVATQILKLEGKRRERFRYAELLKNAFQYYPNDFLYQNPTVMQAYAITLSKSTGYWGQVYNDKEEVRHRFELAVEVMGMALECCERDKEGEEHPHVLKTTLANIYENWARRELEWDDGNFDMLAEKAADLYRKVYFDWPDSAFARYGLSQLLYHQYEAAEKMTGREDLPLEYLQNALEYLEGRPDPSFMDNWLRHRNNIYHKLGQQELKLQELMDQGYEIAYVLKARSLLKDMNPSEDIQNQAIDILEKAENCLRASPSPVPRLLMLYRLLAQHSCRQWEFNNRYQLLTRIKDEGYRFGVQLLYDYAVLSYQLDQHEQGARLFSTLRRVPAEYQINIGRFAYWHVDNSEKVPPPVRYMTMMVEQAEDFSGQVRLDGIKQYILFNPTHPWGNKMRPGITTDCVIRFLRSGPLAVPPHFYKEGAG